MDVAIAERLAKRRKEAGLSQEGLADKLGVSRQAVSKWERSESSPDTDNLIALAKLYDVSLDDLLYVDDSVEDDVEDTADGTAEEDVTVEEDGAQKGDDYVNISWKDGVNIKDSTSGDHVKIGWDGIHVVEGGEDGDEVRVGWKGVHVVEGGASGDEVEWDGKAGVWINGKEYDKRKTIWYALPFPLIPVLIYLWLGFANDAWATAWIVFFSIPIYYALVDAFVKKKASGVLTLFYMLGTTGWYIWNGLTHSIWHPTWLIFLTIPLFGWLVEALFGKDKD